jgi:hypothetical protein
MLRASRNVFTDPGFPKDEAAHLLIRADLMIQLTKRRYSVGDDDIRCFCQNVRPNER